MKTRSFVPNILTFINLSLGILSLLMTMEGNYKFAAIYIIGAGIVDRYDGRIARMLKAESLIGKELDSLADNVSFGVSPAVLVYFMYDFRVWRILGIALILSYCICGMFRLARYNSAVFSGVFTGVPITITGTTLALLSMALPDKENAIIMASLTLIFGFLMVSRVEIRKR